MNPEDEYDDDYYDDYEPVEMTALDHAAYNRYCERQDFVYWHGSDR